MSTEPESTRPTRPSLEGMLARFLANELADPVAGDTVATSEVQPHLSSGFRVPDSRLAFREGTLAAKALLPATEASGFENGWQKHVPEWAAIVRQQQPILALPLAIGNFPQLVQDLAPLFEGSKGLNAAPASGKELETGDLRTWGEHKLAKGEWAAATFAAAALRLAGHLDAAASLLQAIEAKAPATWRPLLLNEKAVLAWHAGRRDEAMKLWQEHPTKANVAIRFNLGLARLCQGQTSDAELLFKQAASELPEKTAWHALAHLYRTLATMG